MLEFDLVDCWREEHTNERKYTWLKKTPLKQARLDFFLISVPLFSSLDDSKISPGYRSDHSIISIIVDINKSTTGHSYWKFNNSLLKDPIHVLKIKETIKQTQLRYSSDEQDSQLSLLEISNNDLKFNISDKLFLKLFC